jgi:hypothetical protein
MRYRTLDEEIENFIRSKRVVNPLNVTLTELQICGGIRLDDIISEQNFRHFRNVLNRKVFGNGYRRFGKELQMLVVREVSTNQRHHIHCIIELPQRYEFLTFKNLIFDVWRNTDFGYEEIHIEKPSSKEREDGYLGYIMKKRTKVSFEQSIDWMNSSVLYH